ncbi:MAG: bifunctional DNA primase/polymerase [Acidimicrobiales bacterium]
MTSMIEAALAYAEAGWPVFPVGGGDERKEPFIKGWNTKASTDPDQVRKWWTKWPDANIGIITGKRLGLWVLDIDLDKEGETNLEVLLFKNDATLDPVCVARTGGGGRHLYFKYEEGLRNRASVEGGIDVRAEGGFVVVPPSVHGKTGCSYDWI